MTRKIKVAAHRIPILVSTVAMILLVLTGCGGGVGNQILPSNTPIPSVAANTTPVTVGQTTTGGHTNGIFTSVTVCGPDILPVGQNPPYGPPPTPTCTTIPNILVDTGSVGLRLLESGQVDALNLPLVTDSNNNPLQDCVQFADFSFVWGPVARATVHIAGEVAAQVPLDNEIANTGIPVQILTLPYNLSTAAPANCLSSSLEGGAPIAANTLSNLGANGILGVGSSLQDCGAACDSSTPRNQYYYCPSNLCSAASVPLDLQLWNPVAAFAYDNNGLALTLPIASPRGSSRLTGSLVFGIGTQADNTLSTQQIFAMDAFGNFPQVTLTQTVDPSLPANLLANYLSPQNGSYIDSGSPAIYFSDAQSLGMAPCSNTVNLLGPLYCPNTITSYSANIYGTNKTQSVYSWNVANADTLLASGNSVFGSLGGDTGINLSTDYVDFGLPFFLGRTVYVGFAGTALVYPPQVVNPITYPNGFWAF